MLPCYACGQCCKNVDKSDETKFLDRGDGTCRNFNDESRLCNIYEDRPLVCRVEDYYKANLADTYEWEDFVQINLDVCQILSKNLTIE